MYRRTAIALLAPAFLASVLPIPAARADVVLGELRPLRQPDGTTIMVRIWGDEFYSVVESLDGYTLVPDLPSGWICYAQLDAAADRLVSTGLAVGSVDPADLGLTPHLRISPAAAAKQAAASRLDFERRRYDAPLAPPSGSAGLRGPSTGNVLGLTLLIDFADEPGTIPPAAVAAYCNQVGFTGYGNNGSVRDYFADVSEGLLQYTNYVPAAYYRAAQPKSYYTNPNIAFGIRARELILEALTALDAGGLDFSQFDADGNGRVDALNCFYAGYSNSAWATGLWPHAWTVYFCADGVCTQNYQMTDMQDSLKLGTFCHENGHMLMGWPDLYDYDFDSKGVGWFCLMAYGAFGGNGTNPVEPCAYLKLTAGWANLTVLTTAQQLVSVPAAGNVIFQYPHPTLPNEYFLIENRRRVGRDAALPDSGLALWHIDTNGSNNHQQQTPTHHYLVTLVQADGRWDLERNVNYGDTTDLFKAPTYTQCTPTTTPNTNWWNGGNSGLFITNISAAGATMTFSYNWSGADCNGNGVPDPIDIAAGTSRDCNGNGIPDECDLASGTSADCDANGRPDECDPDCNGNGLPDACELAGTVGLAGAYYDNINFTGPRVGRFDPQINFNWGSGSPGWGFGADTFSIRWTGSVVTTGAAGTYTFFTRTDDGVRLWVNGVLLIDRWQNQSVTEWSGTIALQADTAYPLRLEYYENTGNAVCELRWRPPGGTKALIPAANLRPFRDCDGNGVIDDCDLVAGNLHDYNGNWIPDECEQPPNQPPVVDAGPDQRVLNPGPVVLDGTVTDDGLPNPPGVVTTTWSVASGPGAPAFANPFAVDTTATFPVAGTYVLRLTADDGFVAVSDTTTVVVVPRGDTNCDGAISFEDIDPFVVALSGVASYAAAYPDCLWLTADCNGDGWVDFDDIDAFVETLSD